jgi:predicted ATP-binding protein involved in virulence
MELVYLWVGKYKNIENQGFNFSPRFTCKYENGELTICDKKKECPKNDYIENFFGNNINITAIVGKNGSGKSSIIEFILDCILDKVESQFILIYDKYYITKIEEDIYKNHDFEKRNDLKDFYTILIDYSADFFHGEHYRENDTHFIFDSNRNYILEPNKFSQNKTNINIDLDNEKNRKRLISYHEKLVKENPEFEKILFVPSEITIRIDPRRVSKCLNKTRKQILSGNYLAQSTSFDDILKLNEIYIESFDYGYINEDEKNKAKNVEKFIKNLKKQNISYNPIYFALRQTENIKKQQGISLKLNSINDDLLTAIASLPRYFLIDFKTKKNVSYASLSTGEKTFQKILYLIIDYILQSKRDNFLIIIDEVELYLHPTWQKAFIRILDKLIQLFPKQNFHFILTSHSPFILSDIPSQNIIFLDQDHQGYCKVVNGLKDKKQTFGANIHTLLSDAFFMENGLIGEFAKTKINEVIDYLNGKDSPIEDDDEAQRYIRIIGEPIVKRQLQRLLDSKKLDKIQEIDALKSQIESLQNRLENLEKKS